MEEEVCTLCILRSNYDETQSDHSIILLHMLKTLFSHPGALCTETDNPSDLLYRGVKVHVTYSVWG